MRVWALDQWYVWRLLSLFVALCLMQLPFSAAASAWQPQWLLMVCLFWMWIHPSKLSIVLIFLVAVMADFLSGLPFGVYVMSLLVVVFIVRFKHDQLKHFNRLHQIIFSMILFLCYFMMMRIGFLLCQLEWSSVMMLKTFISTCLLWMICILRFNFHGFWFNYVD